MKSYKYLISIFILLTVTYFLSSCEKDEQEPISGKLIDTTQDVLQGDSLYMSVEIKGGIPPFAFRYYYEAFNTSKGEIRKTYRNIMGIMDRNFTFAEYKGDSVTYVAESVASYYENVGPAVGSATFNVAPVEYILEENVSAVKTGFIHKSQNYLNYTQANLQLRNASNRASNNTRVIYFEFDATDVQTVADKNRYMLNFWLVSSHSVGINKSSVLEVKGMLGELSDDMKWDTQPVDIEFTSLFTQNFKTTTTDQQIEFSGKIDEIVYKALQNPGSKKFVIRVLENLNESGSDGLFYIGGNLYSEEAKRPVIEVYSRHKKTN